MTEHEQEGRGASAGIWILGHYVLRRVTVQIVSARYCKRQAEEGAAILASEGLGGPFGLSGFADWGSHSKAV